MYSNISIINRDLKINIKTSISISKTEVTAIWNHLFNSSSIIIWTSNNLITDMMRIFLPSQLFISSRNYKISRSLSNSSIICLLISLICLTSKIFLLTNLEWQCLKINNKDRPIQFKIIPHLLILNNSSITMAGLILSLKKIFHNSLPIYCHYWIISVIWHLKVVHSFYICQTLIQFFFLDFP